MLFRSLLEIQTHPEILRHRVDMLKVIDSTDEGTPGSDKTKTQQQITPIQHSLLKTVAKNSFLKAWSKLTFLSILLQCGSWLCALIISGGWLLHMRTEEGICGGCSRQDSFHIA